MKMRLAGFMLVIAAVAGGVVYYAKFLNASPTTHFRTAEVHKGELRIEIKANGTLEPEEVVDVGAQVMGRILELGEDPRAETDPAYKGKRVDYCSDVEPGTILARIDPSLYKATYDQADASVKRAEADVMQMKAKVVQTDAEWKRAQRLREMKLTSISGLGAKPTEAGGQTTIKGISDSDWVMAKANYEVAKANADVGWAVVEQQKAMLASAAKNLEYTIISSPVKGTIIDRRVNIGQTVVASLNAPSLFLIAKDLRRMEIWTSVNEADIGRLKVGMPVRFSVDAYPGEFFKGSVRQIRLNASMTSNVVLYTVVVTAGNDDLRLLPYLTADVRFEVETRDGALLVPNAALRYAPRPELVTQAADEDDEPAKENDGQGGSKASGDTNKHKTVWVRQGHLVSPVEVEIGATDGSLTEIVRGDLAPGTEVVLGESQEESTAEGGTNPFAPPRLRGGKSQKKAG
jgi:HlyD family secretion protein